MNQPATPASAKSEIALPGTVHPVLAVLTFVPVILILLIGLALLVEGTEQVPLMILLTLVIACCAMLSWTALSCMLGGTIKMDADGMTVARFLSETTYPWSSIEACKVILATGTFSDDAMVEADERAGVGLFIRGLGRVRENDLDADVILCAGNKSRLQPLMQINNKINTAIARHQAPGRRKPERRAPQRARQNGQAQQFKQRASDRQAAADPVAQFRRRAPSS